MAELDYRGFDSGPGHLAGVRDARAGIGRFIHLLGGVMSLALVVGMGVWGYRLLVRDVTGIPVIQAMDGPMRIQPEDPGGETAAHQGLAVNRIAAMGEAAPPSEAVVLAPRSTDLSAEDLAQGVLRTQPGLVVNAPVSRPVEADPVEAAVLAATTGVMTAEADLADGLVERALAEVVPVRATSPMTSLHPRPRPQGDAALQLAAASAGADPATTGEIDPATLAPGTILVQFGAYASPEDAREGWRDLGGRFGALMNGKDRVIEEASAGGRTFWRLRALGFSDLADSRRFCAAFVAEGADCIPVTLR